MSSCSFLFVCCFFQMGHFLGTSIVPYWNAGNKLPTSARRTSTFFILTSRAFLKIKLRWFLRFCLQPCCRPWGNFPFHKFNLDLFRRASYFCPLTWLHHRTSLITWLFSANKKAQNSNGEVPGLRGNGVHKRESIFRFSNVDEAFMIYRSMYTNERWNENRESNSFGERNSLTLAGKRIVWVLVNDSKR